MAGSITQNTSTNLLPSPEERISVSALARILNCSAASAWRKMRKGSISRSGECVSLWHVRIGSRLFTTRAAVDDWLERVREADLRGMTEPGAPVRRDGERSEVQRRRDVERATRELQASGFEI